MVNFRLLPGAAAVVERSTIVSVRKANPDLRSLGARDDFLALNSAVDSVGGSRGLKLFVRVFLHGLYSHTVHVGLRKQ